MKLLYCKECGDIFNLKFETVHCSCGKCYGNYEPDGVTAFISEDAVPLGFDNFEFAHAVKLRPDSGDGKRFNAFVIPIECKTVIVEE